MLKKFKSGFAVEVNFIVTGDETRLYYYDVPTKSQNKVWVYKDEEVPAQVRKSKYILSKKHRKLVNKTNYLLFIHIYFIAFKVGPSRNNTLMPTNNPIIKTFFKRIFRNRLQFSPRILLYVFYRLKAGTSKW